METLCFIIGPAGELRASRSDFERYPGCDKPICSKISPGVFSEFRVLSTANLEFIAFYGREKERNSGCKSETAGAGRNLETNYPPMKLHEPSARIKLPSQTLMEGIDGKGGMCEAGSGFSFCQLLKQRGMKIL